LLDSLLQEIIAEINFMDEWNKLFCQ